MSVPTRILLALLLLVTSSALADGPGLAWPSWRGPQQTGTSLETDLPETWTIDGENHLWTYPLAGRGTPVIANGRVYLLGYEGEGADLQEMIVCLDEATGRKLWDHRFSDFLSDSIYSRYAIGSPTIDPATGNVVCLTTAGLLNCFSADGELLWQHSMMEEFGRLTFPNGRTGAPVVDGDLVITRGITTSWGSQGPARDRFFAFEMATGRPVWASTPGTGPKDSCFSHPVLGWRDGRRMLYAGTGCGNVVCIDARTGAPIWRFPMSIGGVNSAVLVTDDRVLAVHGRENLDASEIGRMVAIRRGASPEPGTAGPVQLGRADELWRNDLEAFSSSPVLVGNRLYQTVYTGELACVDIDSGKILWHEKLAPGQIHASPVYGDGKLYVPMNNGSFFIMAPTDEGPNELTKLQLEGNCLAAPAIASGRVYVHTTEKLYCFGRAGGVTPAPEPAPRAPDAAGDPVALICTPSELLLRPGDRVALDVRSVDARGATVATPVRRVSWTVPPTVGVRISDDGMLSVNGDATPGAGVIKADWNGRPGSIRVRIVPMAPFSEDFDGIALTKSSTADPDVKFAFPPSSWIGARLKWDVRELDGNKVLAKTLDRALFQRTMGFFGHPDMHDYTTTMDIMSDGNRRSMSSAGIVNQRYMIVLKGNHQQIEISSNHERIKETVQFRWKPKIWYTLKSRVDTNPDGSTLVRAKAWPRDEPEPDAWNIEFTHTHGHQHGAPGIFGFAPQSRFYVYVDNITVTPND